MARPPMRESYEHVLEGPYGGVNTRTYPTELPSEDYVFIRNIEMYEGLGAFMNRRGTKAYNATLPTASPVRGGVRWYFGGSSKELLMIAGTDIWKGDDGAGTFSSIKSGVTVNRDWFFASYLDRLYIANGIDPLLMRDGPGSTIRNAGFPVPGTVPTVALGAAGILNGTYTYKITFVYDSTAARESSASAASSSIAPVNQQVNLSAIATGAGGSGVTARNIYRTKAGGSLYYFLATIPDNVTTTYVDNIADASLGSTQAPTDNGIPPAGQFVIMWRDRMVVLRTVANPQRLFLSSIISTEKSPGGITTIHGAGVEIFPASHFIDVGDDNTPITGAAVINDQLVVFKEDKIYNLIGSSALDMKLWAAQAAVGCIAPKTIVNLFGNILFLARNGSSPEVFRYNGVQAESLSLPIEPTLKANVKDLGNIAAQSIQPCATRYRSSYLLAYAKTGGGTELGIYDTRPPSPRWAFADKIAASVFMPFYGAGDAGELYYGSLSEGRVLRYDIEDTDYDPVTPTGINYYIETGWMHLGRPYQWKQVRWIEFYGRKRPLENACAPSPGDTKITCERLYDFQATGTTEEMNLLVVTPSMPNRTGSDIWKKRITCQGSGGIPSDDTKYEQGYIVKFKITVQGPLEIYKIVVFAEAFPPGTTHEEDV